MKLQSISDLHLELSDNSRWIMENLPEVAGDVLLIAGDSVYLNKNSQYQMHPFWQWASEHYQQVVVAMGNHEFYHDFDVAALKDGHCTEILPNVKAYYNAVVHLQNTDIIVSTLWSYIRPEDAFYTERSDSDFYRIKYNGHRMRADDFNQEHERCKTFIQQAVLNSKAPNKVVLTHHVPTFLCQAKEFVGSTINGAFVTELGDYIATSNIDYWIYGHSHRNIDTEIGHTRILSNQLGYITHGEHLRNGYKNSKYIEI